MQDLFTQSALPEPERIALGEGAVLLREFALATDDALLAAVAEMAVRAPFRHMITPGGGTMSVAMTNCGAAGWVSDRRGYRYDSHDPQSGSPWPVMPQVFLDLARRAAAAAGYSDFSPDACLVNRYLPGTRLSLHQDRNEHDFDAPIVSVSLGLPANFQFGGLRRTDPVTRHVLRHGDVAVWGGPTRLAYHGVLTLRDGFHDKVGRERLNLTFRRAL